ncbi:MAG TPA: SRPBCC family protein [Usitatibacter sp.]|nr:SRPBCC family protein [Usitatibacter sp.]
MATQRQGRSRSRPSGLAILGGLGLGALAMYLSDPQLGRTRRARLEDRYRGMTRKVERGRDLVVSEARQRAQGFVASIRERLRHPGEPIADEALAERIRAAIGRVTSRSRAVAVSVVEGHATLSGEALADEVDRIARCAKRVRGVKSVASRIVAYETPDGVSSLQGGEPREGPHIELAQDRWSPAWRSLAGAIGMGLTVAGWIRGGMRGLALGAVGSGLVARAAANRDLKSLVGAGSRRRGVVIRKTIHVDAPVDHVFRDWRVESFPQWMSHVREVRPLGGNRQHWVVDGPANVPVEWDSQTHVSEASREMEWHSLPGSEVDNAGSVRFKPEGDGTRVEVTLCYIPIAGAVGQAVARALGRDPKGEMEDDLARFKSVVENHARGAAHA